MARNICIRTQREIIQEVIENINRQMAFLSLLLPIRRRLDQDFVASATRIIQKEKKKFSLRDVNEELLIFGFYTIKRPENWIYDGT